MHKSCVNRPLLSTLRVNKQAAALHVNTMEPAESTRPRRVAAKLNLPHASEWTQQEGGAGASSHQAWCRLAAAADLRCVCVCVEEGVPGSCSHGAKRTAAQTNWVRFGLNLPLRLRSTAPFLQSARESGRATKNSHADLKMQPHRPVLAGRETGSWAPRVSFGPPWLLSNHSRWAGTLCVSHTPSVGPRRV